MTRKEEIQQAAIANNRRFAERRIGFIQGAEWADKTMIEKALKFLLDYDPNDYLEEIADFGVYELNEEKVKIAFYKAMEQ